MFNVKSYASKQVEKKVFRQNKQVLILKMTLYTFAVTLFVILHFTDNLK